MLTLLKGKHFKVKLLYFDESCHGISMQKHEHRSELWLFIFGKGNTLSSLHNAKVPYKKGDFWWITLNRWHQFIPSEPTLVLEIQYGEKCSERDIERNG